MEGSNLSVTIINYNDGGYIGEALETILSQSFKPLEVIVVDDASTDNSVELIEQFVKREPIIRLLRNKSNKGVVFSTNLACERTSGDYVFSQCADNKVLDGFFEKSMQLLAQHPQAGLCCSDPVIFDERFNVVSEHRLGWSNEPRYFSPANLANVVHRGCIAGHTAIIKRSALFKVGGYLPELKWHNDWFSLLVIGFRYGVCYIPQPLSVFTVRQNSYSYRGRRDWSQQSQVLNHLFQILKSPAYSDVLPLFQRSGVISTFGREIMRVVLSNPKHWDFQSLKLIQRPLREEIIGISKKRLRLITPSLLKQLYYCIRSQ